MEFSIILPCYNVTTYLGKCLGSLRENDLRNTEVILVNDGSTDDFKGWCSDYFSLSKDYKWTNDLTIEMWGGYYRILSQHNMGVSAARNSGLAVARGDHILFVDPDDYVSSDLLNTLRDKLSDSPYDMVLYGFYMETTRDSSAREILPQLDKDLYTNKEAITCVLPNFLGYSVEHVKNWYATGVYNPNKEWGAVWRVAYKSSLVKENKILFDTNIVLNEDGVFNMECISHSNSIGVINACLYHYTIRDTGALTKRKKDGLVKNKIALLAAREKIIEIQAVQDSGISLKDFAGSNVFSIIEMMFSCDKKDFGDIKAYILKPSVQKSIQMMPSGSNIKFIVILFFLKIKAYRFLFEVIRVMRKLGIKAG